MDQTTSSTSITWELVRNAEPQAHPALMNQDAQGVAQESVCKRPAGDLETELVPRFLVEVGEWMVD